jgi:DNA-binding response OmpR family regulator
MERGVRVLIVEDSADDRELYEISLKMDGFHVRTAANAREALNLVGSFDPHVIVCDIQLQGENGFWFVRQVRSQYDGIPAIALTGHGEDEYRDEARAAGFTDYCVKPCPPDVLSRIISSAAHSRGVERRGTK